MLDWARELESRHLESFDHRRLLEMAVALKGLLATCAHYTGYQIKLTHTLHNSAFKIYYYVIYVLSQGELIGGIFPLRSEAP